MVQPVLSIQTTVDGFDTQILVQNYADRVMIIVTQVGKIGCLVRF